MTERISFVAGNGVSLSNPTTEEEPSRHRLVRNCRYTIGNVEGGDSKCSYCLEELEAAEPTITHAGCRNAFHEHCFDEVLAANPLLLAPNPAPSKCPICNDLLYPWPALVGTLPPAQHAAREAARRAANTQAQRTFRDAAARRRLEVALGPNAQVGLAAAIQCEFASLNEIARQREALRIGNFMGMQTMSEQRNAVLATLLRLGLGADGNVRRVIGERIEAESNNIAEELAAMQRAVTGEEHEDEEDQE